MLSSLTFFRVKYVRTFFGVIASEINIFECEKKEIQRFPNQAVLFLC